LIVHRQSDLFPFKVKKAQIKDNTFVLHQIKPIIKTKVYLKRMKSLLLLSLLFIVQMSLVKMKKLCVNYHEKPILNNINWTIKRRIFYLLGPNGSGKSTFLLNN
jgi:molybdate transport system ATP-binding protein